MHNYNDQAIAVCDPTSSLFHLLVTPPESKGLLRRIAGWFW